MAEILSIRDFLLKRQSSLYFPIWSIPPIGPPVIIPETFVLLRKNVAKASSKEYSLESFKEV